jgi:hypothetical protein
VFSRQRSLFDLTQGSAYLQSPYVVKEDCNGRYAALMEDNISPNFTKAVGLSRTILKVGAAALAF